MNGIKNKKHLLYIIIVIAAIILIALFVKIQIDRYQYEVSLQIKDTNGNIKDLCLITDDMIERYPEDYRAIRRRVVNKGLNASGVDGYYEDCDCDYIYTKMGMLSGIYICNAYLGDGSEVEFEVDSTVKSGNLKIVITDADNHILYVIPIDSEEKVSFPAVEGMIYYLKFVAESAELEITVTRTKIQ